MAITIRSLKQIHRLYLAFAVNAGLLASVGYAFWRADWQYSLPTPRPEGLFQAPLGSRPDLPSSVASLRRPGRALLVNFANAQCACTEFNLDHVRKLETAFGGQVDFVTILESTSGPVEARQEFQSMHLRMPYIDDEHGEVSTALGVYGTPQAAILDTDGRLYFRGNYNRSRYCTDESSEYVRIALKALISGQALPALPPDAAITYGCPLPHRPLIAGRVQRGDQQ